MDANALQGELYKNVEEINTQNFSINNRNPLKDTYKMLGLDENGNRKNFFQKAKNYLVGALIVPTIIFTSVPGFCDETKKKEAPITATEKTKFSGFAQIRYKEERGFFVPLTVFTLRGKFNQFEYVVELNPAAYFTDKNEMLRDIWVKYKLSPQIQFKAGRQFTFFTVSPPPNKWWLVEYPKMNNELATIYDTGIVAELDTKFLSCYAGVVNGSGEEFSDNNKKKDIYIHPVLKPFENLSFGTVYQGGEQPTGFRKKYGGHAEAEFSSVHVLVEYTAEKIGEQKKDGWYMIAVYTVSNFQLIAQYDEFSAEAKEHTTIIGVNYNPNNKFKLKLNYTSQKKLLACAQFSF